MPICANPPRGKDDCKHFQTDTPKVFSLLITPIVFEVVLSISLALIWYESWSKQGKVDVLTTPHYSFGASNSERRQQLLSSNQRAKETEQATDTFTDKAMESNARILSLPHQKGLQSV